MSFFLQTISFLLLTGMLLNSGGAWASGLPEGNVPAPGNYFFQDKGRLAYTGKVISSTKKAVAAATVKLVSTVDYSVTTDASGPFSVNATPGDTLLITAAGFSDQTYVLSDQTTFTITLVKEDIISLSKRKNVQLLYSSVPANLTAASTAAVYTEDLVKNPVTGIRNTLTGRLAGIITNQYSGQPGNDGVGLNMRGLSPLVVIDGIPRTLTIFDLEEIESVTVLKDALSTAMLGVRGSAGVLSITTRKGSPGKQHISFTAQTASQHSMKMVQPLGSYDYARLYNEALQNDGLSPVYSAADLQAYKDKSDPYGHPDVNWFDKALKDNARFNRYTLSFNGGSQVARYFVSLEHISQSGILLTSNENKYNTNNDFKSYVIRSNVDIDLNKKLSMGLHLFGRILNGNQPGYGSNGAASVLASLLRTPNNAYPVFNPNGSLGGTTQFQNNIYGQLIRSGYMANYKRDAFADLYMRRTLDEITKGLYVRATLSFSSTLSQTSYRPKSFATYKMNISGTDTTYSQFGSNGTQSNNTYIDYQGRQSYVEFMLGYERNFGVHGINAQVLANQDNSVDGSNLPLSYRGISGRVAYDYRKKYVAEVAWGYNGSNRYPEGTRYRLFPSAGLAWNVTEEDFMKSVSWLNRLKVYGSFGKTGWDNAGYFIYKQYYYDGAGAYFGTSATWNTSINEQVLANPNIDYEKANKLNVGVSASLLKDRLSVTAEYYNMKLYDLLQQRGKSTTLIGNDYPNENIGINRYRGVELTLGWHESIKDFSYYVNANASVLKATVAYQDEVFRPYGWMQRTGQPVGQWFGYTAIGLFQTQAEADASPTIDGYKPKPGDIKYKDLNNDGVINQFDESPIGNTKPTLTYGLELGFSFKGFDFSALVQGVKNRNIMLTGDAEWEFQNNGYGQAYQQHLGRWTPENAAQATYPRLTVGTNVNNHISSSYWLHDGSYARLKFVELGYSLPDRLVGRIKLDRIRLFVSATNLLTFSAFDRIDPEVYGGAYPIQRVINTGINIKF